MDIESTGNYEITLVGIITGKEVTPEHIEVANKDLAEIIYKETILWFCKLAKLNSVVSYTAKVSLLDPDYNVVKSDYIYNTKSPMNLS
jgi:hypothetical protein